MPPTPTPASDSTPAPSSTPPPPAAQLSGCDEEVPLLGVTREFDFGQFIELFDDTPDPSDPTNTPILARVVLQKTATLAAARDKVDASLSQAPGLPAGFAGAIKADAGDQEVERAIVHGHMITAPQPTGHIGEVGVFDLFERGSTVKQSPVRIQLDEGANVIDAEVVQVGSQYFPLVMSDEQRSSLAMGLPLTTVAQGEKGEMLLTLEPTPTVVTFLPDQKAALIGARTLQALAGAKLYLPPAAIAAVLRGQPIRTHAVTDAQAIKFVELRQMAGPVAPVSQQFEVFDLPSFLGQPVIYGQGGQRIELALNAADINALTSNQGSASIDLPKANGGGKVFLQVVRDTDRLEFKQFRELWPQLENFGGVVVKPPDSPWPEIEALLKQYPVLQVHPELPEPYRIPATDKNTPQGGGQSGGQSGGQANPTSPALTERVPPRLPTGSGIPVAVFVPWKQTWTLKGFSRGNLLHSIALAPSEEVTMQVFSWERRSRTLEQSSETDTETQTDISDTTRDTDDVFREMLSKNDFSWQLSGSLDASYNTGIASIRVQADGKVEDSSSITSTAKNSNQHMHESTIKASSRVRTRRVTRVTQSIESGREERVTRVIRNPNACHTLTLDFFETLAHYEITLAFVKARMRLVVLLPNPIKIPDFNSQVVRLNESTLRNALLEPALVDGFEACKMVAAHKEAVSILNAAMVEEAKLAELAAQRAKAGSVTNDPQTPDPAKPQADEVIRIVNAMIAAMKDIRDTGDANPALQDILARRPMPDQNKSKAQKWLFIVFCAARFPAILQAFDELTAPNATSGLNAAQRILSVLPKQTGATNLSNLNQMSDREKEEAAWASKLRQMDGANPPERLFMINDWDWGWWMDQIRNANLMTCNDSGIAGMAEELQRAYMAWEAKKAQGAAMKDQDIAKAEAEGRQDKATVSDQLSTAFPLDELARAREREYVLCGHLNAHKEFYNYALFQALPPTEQTLRILEASNGRLQVGLFEPRVVAMSGDKIVVPLTPLAGSQALQDFVRDLGDDLEEAFAATAATPDTTVLPTPGVSVFSRLGKCSTCEEFIETTRGHELTRLEALAKQEQQEALRREKRIESKNYDDFRASPPPVRLEIENTTPP